MPEEKEWNNSDPKPVQVTKNKVQSIKIGNYKCKVCGEKYKMAQWKHSQRSMQNCGRLKRCCENPECEKESTLQAAMKQVEAKRKNQRKEKKGQLESVWNRQDWKESLQKQINWIVRNIDKEYPCIARPGDPNLKFDAGHYYSVANCGDLRFNLHNIHKQGSNSNQFKGGDPILFRQGLVKRYNPEYADYVDGLRLTYKDKRLEFTIPNLKEWRRKAKEIKKRLKKGEKLTRDQINNEIGIYKT